MPPRSGRFALAGTTQLQNPRLGDAHADPERTIGTLHLSSFGEQFAIEQNLET